MEYGLLGHAGWVPGIAPSRHPPSPTTRVHPYPPYRTVTGLLGLAVLKDMVVGLRSVAQLTLSRHFSDIRGITEVYNLLGADNR